MDLSKQSEKENKTSAKSTSNLIKSFLEETQRALENKQDDINKKTIEEQTEDNFDKVTLKNDTTSIETIRATTSNSNYNDPNVIYETENPTTDFLPNVPVESKTFINSPRPSITNLLLKCPNLRDTYCINSPRSSIIDVLPSKASNRTTYIDTPRPTLINLVPNTSRSSACKKSARKTTKARPVKVQTFKHKKKGSKVLRLSRNIKEKLASRLVNAKTSTNILPETCSVSGILKKALAKENLLENAGNETIILQEAQDPDDTLGNSSIIKKVSFTDLGQQNESITGINSSNNNTAFNEILPETLSTYKSEVFTVTTAVSLTQTFTNAQGLTCVKTMSITNNSSVTDASLNITLPTSSSCFKKSDQANLKKRLETVLNIDNWTSINGSRSLLCSKENSKLNKSQRSSRNEHNLKSSSNSQSQLVELSNKAKKVLISHAICSADSQPSTSSEHKSEESNIVILQPDLRKPLTIITKNVEATDINDTNVLKKIFNSEVAMKQKRKLELPDEKLIKTSMLNTDVQKRSCADEVRHEQSPSATELWSRVTSVLDTKMKDLENSLVDKIVTEINKTLENSKLKAYYEIQTQKSQDKLQGVIKRKNGKHNSKLDLDKRRLHLQIESMSDHCQMVNLSPVLPSRRSATPRKHSLCDVHKEASNANWKKFPVIPRKPSIEWEGLKAIETKPSDDLKARESTDIEAASYYRAEVTHRRSHHNLVRAKKILTIPLKFMFENFLLILSVLIFFGFLYMQIDYIFIFFH